MTNEERAEKLVIDITGDKRKASSLASVGYVLSFADEIRRECAERAVAWQVKLCADDDWTCERCTECNQLRYAIMGNIHG